MNADTVISVERVSKTYEYRVDRPNSLKTVLTNLAKAKFDFGQKQSYCALREVSFDIRRGDFVGIMGRNGAGKSTMLKLLSGIYFPTSGAIRVTEPIAPLIELGAGFHPDLSGYENIFLNAAILGIGRAAAMKALPEILDFAELGDKIYMPVKCFSSGMMVRLGFSVATHLAAPILLIDEVLSVGDAGFQKKCLEKIHALHQEKRTVVLVTHDPGAVREHCNRCIVIDRQEKVFDGPAPEGTEVYLRAVNG